jgi:hypothetical protein
MVTSIVDKRQEDLTRKNIELMARLNILEGKQKNMVKTLEHG